MNKQKNIKRAVSKSFLKAKSLDRVVFLSFLLSSIVLFTISACKNKNEQVAINNPETNYIDEDLLEDKASRIPIDTSGRGIEERRIKDGVYTADIEYYNTTTGVNTLYVTKVHVEDGYLKVIKWPDGVWLASEYFEPERIRKDGTCTIKNISGGYENRVKILDLQYD